MAGAEETWRRVDAIFDAALDVEGAEREKLLDRRCAGEPELRRKVQELLRAAEIGGGIEPSDLSPVLEALGRELAGPEVQGRRIGAYRVVDVLGHGGMGTVFLAERADGAFERRVAIKVLPWPLAGSDLAQRFTVERQILADLDHPNIARLLDGGTTEDRLPFLVMEHVDGVPVDRYCRERDLGLDERLELFVEICRAVLFAHQNMVVHRDLKPGNILVTTDGTPKLLDFGLAKLLDPATPVNLTRGGARLLTPAFAAPEQLKGETVSTRSDVYALGGLLYQLLADRPARDLEGLPYAAILRRVCEGPPAPPSSRTAGKDRARRLSGDLDAIVLRAMAPEPERRYATVEALMDDVRRHLDGEPVEAHAGSFAYRAGKLLRRHAPATAAAFLIALSLVAVLLLTVRQLHVEEQQRRSAEQMSRFLADLLTVVDPDSGWGASVNMRRLLDRGVREARDKLVDDPALRADTLAVLAEAASGRDLYDRASDIYREVLALRSDLLGPDAETTLETARHLAWAEAAAGRPERAGPLFERTIRSARRHHGETSEAYADALHSWASWIINFPRPPLASRRSEVESALRRVLQLRRSRGLRDHPKVVATLHDLAYVSESAEEVEKLLREALAMQRRLVDGPHEATARILNDLALHLARVGRDEESIRTLREAVEVHRSLYGDEHPMTISILNNLAGTLRDLGRPATAQSHYEKVLELSRRVYPPGHRKIAFPLYGLGRVLLAQGSPRRAEQRLREARGILTELDDPLRHEAASALGESLLRQGRVEEARPLLETSCEALENVGSAGHLADRACGRLALLEDPAIADVS